MRSLSDSRRLATSIVVLGLLVFALPNSASAHTGFDFSDPADGDTVTQPVTEVTVGFTSEVELVGNGFEALDPQGTLREPSVVSDDDQVFTLLFDPPLAGGGVGIRFEVRAPDGHVLSDSFSFVVDAPVASVPSTSEPAGGPDPTEPATSTTASAPSTTASAPSTTGGPSTTDDDADGSNVGLILAIIAGLAVGIGGFLVVRSRSTSIA